MKKCFNCEKEIETAGNLKFCSAECKKLYNWKKKGSPICKICGKPSYNGAVYCSPECLKKGRHLYNAFSQPEVNREYVYKKLGFTLMRISKPAAHWSKGNKQITDNLLRQGGFSQLFNIKEHIEGTNEELMLAAGWRRVYDCGQSTYLWKRTN